MTSSTTLVLAASDSGSGSDGRSSISAETLLLGIPLVRRAVLSATRAGFERVYVVGGAGAANGVLAGTAARPFPREGGESALPPGRIVLLPDRVAATSDWMRGARSATLEPGRLYHLGSGAIVDSEDPAPLSRALARASGLAAIEADWASALPAGATAGLAAPAEIRTEADLADAERHLLRGLVKKEDGLLTRLVSRKISLAVTRRLAGTPVTPNAMTLVCLALGLAAAACFASPSWPRQVAGGLLFLLHSILDGCDGELARLKFSESRLGGVLDFAADNVVHVAVFSAFAVAWSTAVGAPWPFALGGLAVVGTIAGAGFVYAYAMRPRASAGPVLTTVSPAHRSRLSEILDAVARRDFIYLVMVLSLFGRGYWFLAAAAIGTPAFFLSLLILALAAKRKERRGAGSVTVAQ